MRADGYSGRSVGRTALDGRDATRRDADARWSAAAATNAMLSHRAISLESHVALQLGEHVVHGLRFDARRGRRVLRFGFRRRRGATKLRLRRGLRFRRGVLEEIHELLADFVELFPEGFRGGAGGARGVSRGELLLQVAEKVAKTIKFFLLSRARRARTGRRRRRA